MKSSGPSMDLWGIPEVFVNMFDTTWLNNLPRCIPNTIIYIVFNFRLITKNYKRKTQRGILPAEQQKRSWRKADRIVALLLSFQ